MKLEKVLKDVSLVGLDQVLVFCHNADNDETFAFDYFRKEDDCFREAALFLIGELCDRKAKCKKVWFRDNDNKRVVFQVYLKSDDYAEVKEMFREYQEMCCVRYCGATRVIGAVRVSEPTAV